MSGEVKIEGLAELAAALRALPKELASKNGGPLAKGLRAAANVIKNEAKQRAPVLRGSTAYRKPGTVRDAIRVRRDRVQAPGATETFEVYVKQAKRANRGTFSPNDPFYWRFLEFGTKKMPAKPFIRPAFEAKKNEALNTFEKSLAEAIAKANAKVSG